MAYNNGFPVTYPQYYPQYQQPQIQIPQQQIQAQAAQPTLQVNNPMIWVQGETGAKSYLLAPNTTLPLWDSESRTIYLKSTDASGMPSMKILDYTIRNEIQPQQQNVPIASEQSQPKVDYVTHDELKDFEEKITHKIEEIKEETGA